MNSTKQMQKIVINNRHSGFGLSQEALAAFKLAHNITDENFLDSSILRDDPELIRIVETMGTAANDRYSILKIVEVPTGVLWHIAEYAGREWVAENHRTWS